MLTPPVYSDRPSGQSVHPPVSRVGAPSLRPAAVRVVCLVVHHQLIVHKVEAVRLRLIRVQDHLSDDVLRQRWEFVDVFTGVLAAGHAKAKLKVKTLEQRLSEIMSLDHPEVFYRHVSDRELHGGSNLPQSEKSGGELVTDKSAGIWVNVSLLPCFVCGWRFGDFKQHRGGLHVSDLEPGEVNVENVLVRVAQIILCDLLQTQNILRSDRRAAEQVLLRGHRDPHHVGGVAAFLHSHRRCLPRAAGTAAVSGRIITGRLLSGGWVLQAAASAGTRIAHSAPPPPPQPSLPPPLKDAHLLSVIRCLIQIRLVFI